MGNASSKKVAELKKMTPTHENAHAFVSSFPLQPKCNSDGWDPFYASLGSNPEFLTLFVQKVGMYLIIDEAAILYYRILVLCLANGKNDGRKIAATEGLLRSLTRISTDVISTADTLGNEGLTWFVGAITSGSYSEQKTLAFADPFSGPAFANIVVTKLASLVHNNDGAHCWGRLMECLLRSPDVRSVFLGDSEMLQLSMTAVADVSVHLACDVATARTWHTMLFLFTTTSEYQESHSSIIRNRKGQCTDRSQEEVRQLMAPRLIPVLKRLETIFLEHKEPASTGWLTQYLQINERFL